MASVGKLQNFHKEVRPLYIILLIMLVGALLGTCNMSEPIYSLKENKKNKERESYNAIFKNE